MGDKFYGKILQEDLLGRTNDQIIPQGEGVSQNAFSCNLNTVNLKIFSNHGGIFI